MSQFDSERPHEGNDKNTTLIILIAVIVGVVALFMFYSHLPRASTAAGTSSDLVTPTPQMTNPVSSSTLNRVVNVEGVNVTVTVIQQAGNFSDLRKHSSPYTLRVYVQTRNGGQEPVSIDYPTKTRLQLSNGQMIVPELITISSLNLPKVAQVGYLDFPLQHTEQLSSMVLHFDSATSIPLGNG